jgi:hypothetical protein
LDKHTITKRYDRIFKLLIYIKFAKYQIEKRDFHMKHPNLLRKTKSYIDYKEKYEQKIEDMGARERLFNQNQVMLGVLIHKF